MSEAEWRAVPGEAGHYEVSSHGDVRSLDRIIDHVGRWGPARRAHKGRLLRAWPDCNGYRTVYLSGRRAVNVHRLVALAFIGPPPDGCTDVNHIDGDKMNNAAANLEWCSRTENVLHAQRLGLTQQPRPVIAIPKKGGTPLAFGSTRDAALAMGGLRTRSNIGCALRGKLPSAYGYHWRYAAAETDSQAAA